jgi:hypothetical protein
MISATLLGSPLLPVEAPVVPGGDPADVREPLEDLGVDVGLGPRVSHLVERELPLVRHVVDADGTHLVRLRDEPGVVLSWTPEGRRILVAADESFLTVRPDGSDERGFLEDPPRMVRWLSTGRRTDVGSSCRHPRAAGLPCTS